MLIKIEIFNIISLVFRTLPKELLPHNSVYINFSIQWLFLNNGIIFLDICVKKRLDIHSIRKTSKQTDSFSKTVILHLNGQEKTTNASIKLKQITIISYGNTLYIDLLWIVMYRYKINSNLYQMKVHVWKGWFDLF